MSEEQALEKNKDEYEALNENISRLTADSPTKQIIKFLTRGLRYIRVIGKVSMLYEGYTFRSSKICRGDRSRVIFSVVDQIWPISDRKKWSKVNSIPSLVT